MKIRLSSSKRSTLKNCPYRLFLEQLGITPVKKSSALIHGSAWHTILETFYQYIKDNGWDNMPGAVYACGVEAKKFWAKEQKKSDIWMDYRNFQTEMEMLMKYIATYSDEGFLEVTAVEEKFECLVPLDTYHKEIKEITYSGVIDLRCKISGIPWLVDHKTTSGSVPSEANKLNRSLQFIGYSWGEQQIYGETEGFMANFAGCSSKKKKDGNWGKKNITFLRSPQLYTEEDFNVFIQDVNFTAREIATYTELGVWPKYYSNCYNYGRCALYNQCQSGCLEPIDGYKYEEPGSKLTYE